ncbi:mannosyl-oligosaccharide 1,2-alpha-mannosidase [Tribonema minus]|uniref:alpha-1,2-Mannosidase n=1 Tax=Tribonema minus TaxID=303371 RepID=A0A835YU30_9STRA|nr:mannosyl-oligosaccharide 1,2-alpha-mannosidase [Tribonema minus]
MQFVWGNYKTLAWGKDELKPASGTGQDNWGGLGVTLVDTLDTLWLMGLKNEFAEATAWVRDSLTFANAGSVSVFETTIRELGGLLSAYDLSGEKVFLEKAQDLGDRLMPAFDTPSGLPVNNVEFRYLSHATGNPIYASAVNKVEQIFDKYRTHHALVCSSSMIVDAAHYLLKVWLQGGKSEDSYRHAYDAAVDGMVTHLAKKTEPSGLLYFSDWDGTRNKLKMDHLACFMAGSLGLGAATSEDKERAQRDMKLGKVKCDVQPTCTSMYLCLCAAFKGVKEYLLRPEVAESMFILHQLTGDPIFREWSWEIFEAIEKRCKTRYGYGAFRDVTNERSGPQDRMESFFLAETLKYLYLIQDTNQPIRLDTHVFNTEAHPLRIFGRDSIAAASHVASA